MNLKTLAIAATLSAALGVASGARAAEIRPAAAGSIGLGALAGSAYYTVEPKGYHVVVTLAPRGAAPALRLETVLAADQSVTLSTPRMPGEPAEAVEIARVGDRVSVSPGLPEWPVREADAGH